MQAGKKLLKQQGFLTANRQDREGGTLQTRAVPGACNKPPQIAAGQIYARAEVTFYLPTNYKQLLLCKKQ